MTEYGRGYGSEPWHPEDPLYGESYGDQGAYGGQASYGNQDPYAGQQQPGWDAPGPEQQHQYQYDAYGQAGQPGGVPYDPYGGQQPDPYGRQPDPYGGAAPDYYGTHDGYPPPHQPQQLRHDQTAPMPVVPPGPQGDDWQPAGHDAPWQDEAESARPEPEPEHAFFSGGDADADAEDDAPAPRENR
ncbi:hypothetical protein ABT381_14365, partial [Streptomyces sp. NPDC000151]